MTTNYIGEGGVVIAEYSTAGGQSSGGTRYYHQDRLSTRLITDLNGGVMGTNDHLPFGEDAGTTGETEKHRFTSYERDAEVGTDYAVNRQHSAGTGRFTQVDPNSGSILYPGSLNRYSYVGGDAINMVDPTGLKGENIWSLYRGLSLPGVTNLTLDGVPVQQYQLSYFAHLWISGGTETPWGAYLRTLPEWYKKEYHLQDPNDLWQLLPVGSNSDQQLVFDIAYEASKLLDNAECASYLGGAFISAADLKSTFQKMSERGQLRATRNQDEVGYDADGRPAVASTDISRSPVGGSATIIRFGPVFLNRGRVGGAADYFPNAPGKDSTRLGMILVMLHELGHAAGADDSYHKSQKTTEEYDRGILRKCFGIK